MRRKLVLVSVCSVVALAGTSGVLAANFTPGSSGLGDPFFPLGGNGGYDVDHYGLTLAYDPPSNQLTGTAEITATATQNLSQFDLDLRGFTITRLDVNGAAARFTRDGQELMITPARGLPCWAAIHGRRRLPGRAHGGHRP